MTAADAPFVRWAAAMRQPSLLRRLMLTLLAAVLASFAVLLAIDWLQIERGGPGARAVTVEARALALSLPGTEGDTQAPASAAEADAAAIAIVQATDRRARLLRAQSGWPLGPVLLRLDVLRPGTAPRTLLATAAALRDLPGSAATAPQLTLDGQVYWASSHQAGPWRVWMLDPAPSRGLVLRWLGRELLPSYLIALPLVMLPLAWAALTGLRPLRQWAQAVRQRQPGDTSPLARPPTHAELQPLAAALDALAERTRQALAHERRFVQDAAHELRTPLAVIATRAHALAHAGHAGERARELAAIEQAVARTSHLGQQLLTLAGLDDGAPRPGQRRTLDLVAQVQQVLADALPQADARGIELGLDSPATLPVHTDAAALQSVLENLVGNAIVHGRQGGQMALTLGATAEGGWRLRVADDGPGIAPGERETLFQPFQRGRQVQARGSGLGLAIVRAAVQRLGGHIAVTPGLHGRGVGFEVSVPNGSGGTGGTTVGTHHGA